MQDTTKEKQPNHNILKLVMLDIYKKRINDLLNIIHSNYSQEFKKENIKTELDNILGNIILNIGQTVSKPSVAVEKKKRDLKKIDLSERCIARIWNSIFDRKTGKEVSDIDDCFKVTDFNDIDNIKFFKKYIIGSRCSKKHSLDKNYCALHLKHVPHGDFEKLPSKEICFHFIKDGNY